VTDPRTRIRQAARDIRSALVPDLRVEVFEVRVRSRPEGVLVSNVTTVSAAAQAFRRRLGEAGVEAEIITRVLPDPALAPRTEALVRAPVAPVYRRPTLGSHQITQYVLGTRLTLLSRRGRFYRIRGEDAHVGWVHRGYLIRGEPDWALAWERAEGGQPVVSLGAEVHDETDRVAARLPWGARVIQQAGGRILLPDGRAGHVATGEVVQADRLWDRFPSRAESVVRTARRWLGAPYLWGGVTPHGVDCSGLVQAVFWVHGVALPRDSDMQAGLGVRIDPGQELSGLRSADLLFYAENRRVNHVALSLGGSEIIHASVGNGVVALNDMAGSEEMERYLRSIFVGARRLLPDNA